MGVSDQGRGVFALQSFSAGETVLTFIGRAMTPKQAANPAFSPHCLQTGLDRHLYVALPSRYVNHSCAPNCGLSDAVTLMAVRDIAAGEEISFDYSTCVLEKEWCMPCACQEARCRGVIRDFSHLDGKILKRYLALKIVPSWLKTRLTA